MSALNPMPVAGCNFSSDAEKVCVARRIGDGPAVDSNFGVQDRLGRCVTLGMPQVMVVGTPLDDGEPNFCENYGTDPYGFWLLLSM